MTHFPDGTVIRHFANSWNYLEDDDAAYCYYDNNSSSEYGALYTYAAALNACPDGWHLPTDDEWKTLEMHLGMSQAEADDLGMRGTDEGGKLKETGTTHWNSPNTGATNESGFTALPGGYRESLNLGFFENSGNRGYWWTATQNFTTSAWGRYVNYDNSNIFRHSHGKASGISVRCLKDD